MNTLSLDGLDEKAVKRKQGSDFISEKLAQNNVFRRFL